jgi:hypothetical protein
LASGLKFCVMLALFWTVRNRASITRGTLLVGSTSGGQV